MNRRFAAAMSAYALLAVLAGVTLEGDFRLGVWIFLGGIAVKTWIAVLRKHLD